MKRPMNLKFGPHWRLHTVNVSLLRTEQDFHPSRKSLLPTMLGGRVGLMTMLGMSYKKKREKALDKNGRLSKRFRLGTVFGGGVVLK